MKFMLKIKKRYFVIAAIVSIVCVVLFGFTGGHGKKDKDFYKTFAARRTDLRSVISATGTLEATETVDVGTQISGKITDLYVDYNSIVKEGELIARMDSATQETDARATEANYISAKADLQASLAKLDKAEKDYKRSKELVEQDLVAKSSFDAAESELKTARAAVAVSKAKVNQTYQTFDKAKITLGYTYIYAPVNGIVVAKNVEVGQTVAASYSTPSIVKIARDLTKMQVEINVDEADIGSVKKGQTAEFTVDSYPERKYIGKVTQIRLSPTTKDNVVTYTVIAQVENDDFSLFPGMSANVELILKEVKNVLAIPESAFRFKPIAKKKDGSQVPPPGMGKAQTAAIEAPSVYLLDEKNKPVKRNVKKGISDGKRTEIVSGLKEGEKVIIGVNLKKEEK